MQCFTALTFVFDIAWPAKFKSFSLGLNFINLDLGNLLGASSCSFALPELYKFYIHMAMPLMLLCTVSAARVPAYLVNKGLGHQKKQK